VSTLVDRDSAIEVLLAARRIADWAKDEGVIDAILTPRATCDHMGGLIADSILQAGLNYKNVVRPRVMAILESYPHHDTISAVLSVINGHKTGEFLNWNHIEKVTRFESLVAFLSAWGIEDTDDLRTALLDDQFCEAVQTINGIGPKTVDYMACLVGIDSIAVDRHIRTYAKKVGVQNTDYQFLHRSFCYAADLLELPRRELDAWLWRSASTRSNPQLSLTF
jgi:hypothetical protein